jgi:glycosyltransferase involved in cell wall biosynthesis
MLKLAKNLLLRQPTFVRRGIRRAYVAMRTHAAIPENQISPGNIVVGGYLGSATGLGEGARFFVERFKKLGLPVEGANFSHIVGPDDLKAGPLWSARSVQGGNALFVANPNGLDIALAMIGRHNLAGRRLIGHWAWELEIVPPSWSRILDYVHEIWAPSKFVAESIWKLNPNKPIHVVPYPLAIDNYPQVPTKPVLPHYGNRPIILFIFDVRSSYARKNPEAVVAAYREAQKEFPEAVLVIKAGGCSVWPESEKKLEALIAGDPNILLIKETLPIDDLRNLITRSDIIISLHRSEGYGLLMAQGMMAAKPVIATGWSANLDFMSPENSCLIGYKMVPVEDPQGYYSGLGAFWADAHVGEAAAALKMLLANPEKRRALGARAQADIRAYASEERWKKMISESFWQNVQNFAK